MARTRAFMRQHARALRRANARQPERLTLVPPENWPKDAVAVWADSTDRPTEVWRSRKYLVLGYEPALGAKRLSVIRAEVKGAGWSDGLSWEALQRVKAECGFGDRTAVEVFPPESDVVNVHNMRHLWILDENLPFAWVP